MKTYTIIDINGKTHEVIADDCVITDNTFINFLVDGKVLDKFVVRNVISITEGNVDKVEEEVSIDLDKVCDRHGCYDCKYNDRKLSDEPCMTCDAWGSCWEKKEEKND